MSESVTLKRGLAGLDNFLKRVTKKPKKFWKKSKISSREVLKVITKPIRVKPEKTKNEPRSVIKKAD